jgi:hypothetical protein
MRCVEVWRKSFGTAGSALRCHTLTLANAPCCSSRRRNSRSVGRQICMEILSSTTSATSSQRSIAGRITTVLGPPSAICCTVCSSSISIRRGDGYLRRRGRSAWPIFATPGSARAFGVRNVVADTAGLAALFDPAEGRTVSPAFSERAWSGMGANSAGAITGWSIVCAISE